ncbi:MAG: Na+/H+ antiporter subunit C [Spongiibacteraceae bacterium]|jgi:multicomponent K+:H+ antiporter subunit C|nr:Na+/H+ antiporter subunit C [Spongiibacteraceae bacterium]
MELLFAMSIGVLVATGAYLLLRAHTFPVMVGLTLLSYAVNLFLFGMGRLGGAAPIIGGAGPMTDPVPQALVLTAIVIGFAMTAFTAALALRGFGQLGHDRADDSDPWQRGSRRYVRQDTPATEGDDGGQP